MKKIDLHTHTISTISDYEFKFDINSVKLYVDRLGIDALAITNHNEFDLNQYYEIRNSLEIPVFPGIEVDLEGGHILVIADLDDFEVSNFEQRCKLISSHIRTVNDDITVSQFNEAFPDLSKYLLIPHYDKKPIIRDETLIKLNGHISSGEVASFSKFIRGYKDKGRLVPVLFSDIRFHDQLTEFPTRQTYVDLDNITLSGLKSCLFDRSKVSLTKDGGNDFFQATDEGLMLSTGLNVILGERSTGKTLTLNKIAESSGNAKYIRQFSLLQNDEEKFNQTNIERRSLIQNEFLKEFKDAVEDVLHVDKDNNDLLIQNYLESLIKYAGENEKKDLYAKCALFSEELFSENDTTGLEKLIQSVIYIIDNTQYEEIINKHVNKADLQSLAIELITELRKAVKQNLQQGWVNTVISDVQRELRVKTSSPYVDDLDLYKIALDQKKIKKFNEIVEKIKEPREVLREDFGKFTTVTKSSTFKMASDLRKVSRDKTAFSEPFKSYTHPFIYLQQLRNVGVSDSELFKYFVKIESVTLNSDGFPVSGGERSEYNLIHEIQDATKYDILLIDEPESSFDNLFLRKEINSLIKDISSLIPVVVVTHNSTVGASIKPNYLAVTHKNIESGKVVYRIFTGYPSDKELSSPDGLKVKNLEMMLNCLEAGPDAYVERKTNTYEILKD